MLRVAIEILLSRLGVEKHGQTVPVLLVFHDSPDPVSVLLKVRLSAELVKRDCDPAGQVRLGQSSEEEVLDERLESYSDAENIMIETVGRTHLQDGMSQCLPIPQGLLSRAWYARSCTVPVMCLIDCAEELFISSLLQ